MERQFRFVALTVIIAFCLISGTFSGHWDLVTKTCDREGAGTDAQVFLNVSYNGAKGGRGWELFLLDGPRRNDFERNARDHFSLALSSDDVTNLGIFWWPSYTFREALCIDWVILLNPRNEYCFIAVFEDWILNGYLNELPSYPKLFKASPYAECIDLPLL